MLVGSRPKIFVVAFLPSTSAFLSRKTFGDSTDHQNVSTRSFADAIIAHDASRLSDGVHCCLQRPLCATSGRSRIGFSGRHSRNIGGSDLDGYPPGVIGFNRRLQLWI